MVRVILKLDDADAHLVCLVEDAKMVSQFSFQQLFCMFENKSFGGKLAYEGIVIAGN